MRRPFVLTDSSLRFPLSRVLGYFSDNEYASLLLESPSETGNVLTKESFDALWDLHDIVMAIEVW